mgnify:CR=1 FL=1
MYVGIRRDLSRSQQVVQSCHAAIEATRHFLDKEHPSVIVLGKKTLRKLETFRDYIEKHNLKYKEFYEPDRNNELTSVAVYPVSEHERILFKKFQLLN